MTEEEIKAAIEVAFANTPPPGQKFDDISATTWDEGIVDYFRNTTWRGHRVVDLRRHSAALSFFTDKAFRYWLPAFMLADLENPEQADIIAESIAFHFTHAKNSDARLAQFSPDELAAIAAFMDHSARTSNPIPGTPDPFREAETVIRTRLSSIQNH